MVYIGSICYTFVAHRQIEKLKSNSDHLRHFSQPSIYGCCITTFGLKTRFTIKLKTKAQSSRGEYHSLPW